MKSDETHIRKGYMEQLNPMTNFLRIKDQNILITDEFDRGTHLELHGHLDYIATKCPSCKGQMTKYDFQKASKIPYLETAGYPLLIRLRKRRFKCKDCGKIAVAEMERENIISQAMEGRRSKARVGQWNGGFAPVGYSLVNGQLQVNHEEAESVKMIFDLFTNSDMGTTAIAKHFVNLDIKKPIRHNSTLPYFSSSGIARILDNPVYNGKIAFGRRESTRDKVSGETKVIQSENYILTDGIHETIIDDETWNNVRKKRKAKLVWTTIHRLTVID